MHMSHTVLRIWFLGSLYNRCPEPPQLRSDETCAVVMEYFSKIQSFTSVSDICYKFGYLSYKMVAAIWKSVY